MKEDKMLYTVKEVSSTLGVNVHIVYDLIKKGASGYETWKSKSKKTNIRIVS